VLLPLRLEVAGVGLLGDLQVGDGVSDGLETSLLSRWEGDSGGEGAGAGASGWCGCGGGRVSCWHGVGYVVLWLILVWAGCVSLRCR
jgi:hypothetical protein